MNTVGKLTYQPQLVSVNDIEPAVYNPREADELRLGYLTTSIRYLGFVLPLYSTPEGHLLSGHQRLTVAKEIGCKQVPVVYVPVKEHKWKQANILFNRITNDMDSDENSELYVNELQSASLDDLLEKLEPLTPDTPEFYPCMNPIWRTWPEIEAAGMRDYSSHGVSYAHAIMRLGVLMPALQSAETDKVVNGTYRVYGGIEHQRRKGIEEPVFPMVQIPEKRAALAEALVNLVSMRFTVEKQMGNLLRYGGYRRPENKVEDLVVAMRYWADGKRKKSANKSLEDPKKFWHNFREVHGNSIADMGAGQRRNGIILRQKGITCADWEPYPCDWQGITEDKGDRPSLELARIVSNEFLDQIEAGVKFTSVFANAVINSIPFHEDRMAFLALCHSICSFHTGFYGTSKWYDGASAKDTVPLNRIDEDGNVVEGNQMRLFQVPYEKGVFLTDMSRAPKIQKYHTHEELMHCLSSFWAKPVIYSWKNAKYAYFECHAPKRINPKTLRTALEMEFDMPYPDGSIGLVDRALKVFSARHNVDLFDPKYAPDPRPDR